MARQSASARSAPGAGDVSCSKIALAQDHERLLGNPSQCRLILFSQAAKGRQVQSDAMHYAHTRQRFAWKGELAFVFAID